MTTLLIPVQLLFDATQAYLDDRERTLNEQKEALIAEKMTKPRNWLAKAFGCKPFTREQAIKILTSVDGHSFQLSEFGVLELAGGAQVVRIKQLRQLARIGILAGQEKVAMGQESASPLLKYVELIMKPSNP